MNCRQSSPKRSSYSRVSVTPSRCVRQHLSTIPVTRNEEAFILTLRGRPDDQQWLKDHGFIAKCMNLSFETTARLVRAHVKKLCGYRDRGWLERGLREGYTNWGLRS